MSITRSQIHVLNVEMFLQGQSDEDNNFVGTFKNVVILNGRNK